MIVVDWTVCVFVFFKVEFRISMFLFGLLCDFYLVDENMLLLIKEGVVTRS